MNNRIFVLLMAASVSMILISACGQDNQAEPPAANNKVKSTVAADKVEPTVAAKKVEPAVVAKKAEPAVAVPAAGASSASLEDRLASGKKVYTQVCSACHQANGQGLKGAFPPLAASDTLAKEGGMFAVHNALYGLSGPITVNGVAYNSVMPPVAHLSDTDIADVVTYVMNSWDNPGGEISADQVAASRKEGK